MRVYEVSLVHETRANVIGLLDRKNKNSSVADLTCSCGFVKDSYEVIDLIVVRQDLDLHFRQECQLVFDAAVNRWMSFLPATPAHFGDGHSGRNGHQLIHNVIQFFLPNDALNQLHVCDWRYTRKTKNGDSEQFRAFGNCSLSPVFWSFDCFSGSRRGVLAKGPPWMAAWRVRALRDCPQRRRSRERPSRPDPALPLRLQV